MLLMPVQLQKAVHFNLTKDQYTFKILGGFDMKGIAIFLSSKASDYLNGAIIPTDGGYLSR